MATGRNTPQQDRSRATVTRVLDAADELFGELGVHETQIAQIIERSGVSAGSIYRFFPDKLSIAAALLDRYREDMGELVAELPPVATMDELLTLVDITVDVSATHQANNPGYRALTAVFPASDPTSPLFEMRKAQIDLIVSLVANVADHLPLAERYRIVSYMAVIMDAIINTTELEPDRFDRAREAKRVIRGYALEVLTPK